MSGREQYLADAENALQYNSDIILDTDSSVRQLGIVGAGPHGLHVGMKYLDATPQTTALYNAAQAAGPEDVVLLDEYSALVQELESVAEDYFSLEEPQIQRVAEDEPWDQNEHGGIPIGQLRDWAANLGLELSRYRMRSPVDHHLHPHDANVIPSAEEQPTLNELLDHSIDAVQEYGLLPQIRPGRVEYVEDEGDYLAVHTGDDVTHVESLVVSTGPEGEPRVPSWAEDVAAHRSASIHHVFDYGYPVDRMFNAEGRIAVVGGGITASELAITLAHKEKTAQDVDRDVLLLPRSEPEVTQTEFDESWMYSAGIRENFTDATGRLLPLSERYHMAHEEHASGTITPYISQELLSAVGDDRITYRISEVQDAFYTPSRDEITLEVHDDGSAAPDYLDVDHVILATGIEPEEEPAMLVNTGEALGLQLEDVDGVTVPVLDYDTLAWKRMDGTASNIHFTGPHAAPYVGPSSFNFLGGRLAADRIVPDLVTESIDVNEPSPSYEIPDVPKKAYGRDSFEEIYDQIRDTDYR